VEGVVVLAIVTAALLTVIGLVCYSVSQLNHICGEDEDE